MTGGISRRSFIKGVLAGTAAVAAGGLALFRTKSIPIEVIAEPSFVAVVLSEHNSFMAELWSKQAVEELQKTTLFGRMMGDSRYA